MEPPPALREPSQRVSPRARLMWAVTALVEGVVTLVALTVVVLLTDVPWWLVPLAAAAIAAYVAVVPQWRYAVHRWEVTETAVHTQTGWWARERRIAPMSRVQTVDLAEGPLDRLFGLTTLTVTTASAAGPLRVEGLERGLALELSERLTRKAEDAGGDAT